MAKISPGLGNELKVSICFGDESIPVGRLAINDYQIYFEYFSGFVKSGLEISPFKLPLQNGLQVLDKEPFEGLAGVFNDSLSDGWGRLLFDRLVRSNNILPESLSPLDRLAYVGSMGMGALIYEPDYGFSKSRQNDIQLDELYQESIAILEGKASDVLEKLIKLNGSSAGARPKALIGVNFEKNNIISHPVQLPKGFEHWIVKFPNTFDGNDAGAIEYVYALMAKKAGVDMMPVHLFESKISPGFFATKRFDRTRESRYHVHTASGLLHADFRFPSLDYKDLIKLTGILTKDAREVEKMYRWAVFNVLSHNRDDHAKNFSFLMDKEGRWTLSPAYDLTFSSGPGGQQSTMLMGEGQNPGIKGLLNLGHYAKLKPKLVEDIINSTQEALSQWEILAKANNVENSNIKLIKSKIKAVAEN